MYYRSSYCPIMIMSMQNTKNLIRILCCFELTSSFKNQHVQMQDFSVGLEWLLRSMNCSIGNFPLIYLRIPVGARMSRTVYWNQLIEKFQTKLSKWKASTLSFESRLTMCKVVLRSIGSFLFSLYKAPVKIFKSLEKPRCRCFWGWFRR